MEAEGGELLDVSEDFAKFSANKRLRTTCFLEQRVSSLGKVVERSDIKGNSGGPYMDGSVMHVKYGLSKTPGNTPTTPYHLRVNSSDKDI